MLVEGRGVGERGEGIGRFGQCNIFLSTTNKQRSLPNQKAVHDLELIEHTFFLF